MGKYFGTDGIRGVAGKDLTPEIAYRVGRYLGQAGDKEVRVILARDTRISGELLKSSLTAGLSYSGAEVFDLGISTTPSVSYLVENGDFTFGVMVSASHNPYGDNGIKVFGPSGEKIDEELEGAIEIFIDAKQDTLPRATNGGIGYVHYAKELKLDYMNFLRKYAPSSRKLRNVKVLADLANGSASAVVPELFSMLGVEATYIGNHPNGININLRRGAAHIERLRSIFSMGGYDIGFSFDGDSDRFIGLAPDGRVIDGDALIYLLALKLKKEGRLANNTVVITVMSNYGLRKALEKEGIAYETVSVGDRNVQLALREHKLSLGGEQSGHVIYAPALNTGDGILSALLFLDIFVNHPDIYQKLDDFVVYPQILKNISFDGRKDLEDALNSEKTKKAIKEAEELLGKDGRLLVRPSGTEVLLRVMAEHIDEETCAKAVDFVVESLGGN